MLDQTRLQDICDALGVSCKAVDSLDKDMQSRIYEVSQAMDDLGTESAWEAIDSLSTPGSLPPQKFSTPGEGNAEAGLVAAMADLADSAIQRGVEQGKVVAMTQASAMVQGYVEQSASTLRSLQSAIGGSGQVFGDVASEALEVSGLGKLALPSGASQGSFSLGRSLLSLREARGQQKSLLGSSN